MGTSFWATSCPARGPGLPHAHWGLCRGNHMPIHDLKQCCHCGTREDDAVALAVAALLDDSVPDELVEPKMITGDGPTGWPVAIGRGPLEPRDERRLVFYVGFLRERGLRREPG